MIDFRYHLVSLISVFMALAVGIVLGAGPLKQPIGESLESQVESLRTDRDNLRAELDATNASIQELDQYITKSSPSLLRDTAKDQDITVIRGPQADSETLKQVNAALNTAGANVSDAGQLTAQTLDPADSAELIDTLRELDPNPPDDAREALETALAKALSGQRENTYDEDTATEVIDAFRSANRLNAGTFTRADAVVFIMGQNPEDTNDQPAEDYTGLITKLGERVPTVVTGTVQAGDNGAIKKLRDSGVPASTVDGVDLSAGSVLTALAVVDLLVTGQPTSFGFSDSAKALLPDPLPTGGQIPTASPTPTEEQN